MSILCAGHWHCEPAFAGLSGRSLAGLSNHKTGGFGINRDKALGTGLDQKGLQISGFGNQLIMRVNRAGRNIFARQHNPRLDFS